MYCCLMQEDIKRRDLPRAALSTGSGCKGGKVVLMLELCLVCDCTLYKVPLLIPSTSTNLPAIEPVSEKS